MVCGAVGGLEYASDYLAPPWSLVARGAAVVLAAGFGMSSPGLRKKETIATR